MSGSHALFRTLKRPVQKVLRTIGSQIASLDPRFYYKREVGWCNDLAWTDEFQPYLNHDGRRGRRILDRRFTLVQMARAVHSLRGCTAECGVARGVGSAVICTTLKGTYQDGERHLGFDSFDGVAAPTEEDRMRNGHHAWYRGKLSENKDFAFSLLADVEQCQLVRGWIPDSFAPFSDCKFRLVHIDVDLHDATRDSLRFFYPRLVPGGIMLFDDHGFVNCPGARSAAESFFSDKPERLIDLATGQAFAIRGDGTQS